MIAAVPGSWAAARSAAVARISRASATGPRRAVICPRRCSTATVSDGSSSGRCGSVDRRTRQDVAELNLAVAEGDEADRFGRDELLGQPRVRALQRLQLARVAGGGDQECLPCRLGQRLGATEEPLRDATGDG